MNRRSFLGLAGGGLVASATMAEVGIWAEFMSWLQRKPVWSFPVPVVASECLPRLATIWYNKAALDRLKENFAFAAYSEVEASERRIKQATGKVQFYHYGLAS